jgi:carboxyl-terminal processing protease
MVGGKRSRKGSRMMRKTPQMLLSAATGAALMLMASQPRIVFDGWSAHAAASDAYRQLTLFGEVFERVRTQYVEKPDDNLLIEMAISGMLISLDPHSSYMSARTFQDMQLQTSGKFGGLGMEVTMEDGLVKVIAPIEDSPAHKAGILAGDSITHIDGQPVLGLTLNEAVDKMRGLPNTRVKVRVVHRGTEQVIEVSIVRDIIRVRSVRSNLIGDDVAYIRETQFNELATDGVQRAINDLSTRAGDRLKGFIVDIRNNPGGLLDQAVSMSDAFLEQGEIVSTRGRNVEEALRFNARAGDLANAKPIIVLINGGSASASEIVAGALQDHKRATIIGTRSFGKGSVQTIIPLGSGNGALRLTTARYFTPSGRSIQAKGITPDIEVLQDIPEELKARPELRGEASLPGHLKGDSQEETGSQSYVPADPRNDKALNLALDLMRGIKANSAFPPMLSARKAAN